MCGIAGAHDLTGQPIADLGPILRAMNHLQRHRGPDGAGTWQHPHRHIGFAHRRLSVIDLPGGGQPMTDDAANWLVFNGEIYNYLELRDELGNDQFTTRSDTEVILRAYRRWGERCVEHLRGMFAFALWDERGQKLFCARDRFGIKPFYYTQVGDTFSFASEAKALLPLLPHIETDLPSLADYLTLQLCLDGRTLFKDIYELQPGHVLVAARERIQVRRYWQLHYSADGERPESYFIERLTRSLTESVELHRRSDVPIGGYLSGGLDSTIIACLATQDSGGDYEGFLGKFALGERFDESRYARQVARTRGFPLHEIDITAADFSAEMRRVIYHLDYPVAGPGSFAQYMVSRLARQRRKVVLGGQGADEIFGGYARYLIAYLEQCLKTAIVGPAGGNVSPNLASIIPSLQSLRGYRSLLQEFWREGLFDDMDRRYFRLINRAPALGKEVRWEQLDGYSVFDRFLEIFRDEGVGADSYFERMTHFDFRTLLPALLQVEDRMSMAHGLESRVPFLDHPLVEFAATIPADIKFKNGEAKHVLRQAMSSHVPPMILERTDKMGFPVPLTEWLKGEAREFVHDILSTRRARTRDLIDNRAVLEGLESEPEYGRKIWGLLSLEIWQQEFHDRAAEFRELVDGPMPASVEA
ncbi:asparagine synthetase B [Planctomycetaceae bacterium SCGC AG-212-D15]|nr:asparagine synthetase B [Planctomycetaceae bacterium SCGC AG-212-D15]